MYGNTDKYGIYQLKDDPELDKFRFTGTESLKRMGITKDNWHKTEQGIDRVLGELARCGNQFVGDIKEYLL